MYDFQFPSLTSKHLCCQSAIISHSRLSQWVWRPLKLDPLTKRWISYRPWLFWLNSVRILSFMTQFCLRSVFKLPRLVCRILHLGYRCPDHYHDPLSSFRCLGVRLYPPDIHYALFQCFSAQIDTFVELHVLKVSLLGSSLQRKKLTFNWQSLALTVTALTAIGDVLIAGALCTMLHLSRTGVQRYSLITLPSLLTHDRDCPRSDTIINKLVSDFPSLPRAEYNYLHL